MNTGNLVTHRSVVRLLALFLLVLPGLQGLAQTTPTSTCANDSLFLISPEAILFNQNDSGRTGLTLSWRDLSLPEATCFVLTDTDTLNYVVQVEGGFGDQVDRQMVFASTDSGSIGTTDPTSMLMTWVTEGPSTYGVLGGIVNLANNGGVFNYSASTGLWEQKNTELPMTWRNTNTTAFDHGQGDFVLAGFSGGQSIGSNAKGLFAYDGARWTRIAEDVFTDLVVITSVSISPGSNDRYAVGTTGSGLFVTDNGGVSFTNWGANLDPDYSPSPVTVNVTQTNWSTDYLWVFVPAFGLFSSSDDAVTFNRSDLQVEVDLDNLDLGTFLPVRINDIVSNPSNSDHVLIAMEDNGVFQSFDAGQTWNNTYGDLMVADPDTAGEWRFSASTVMVDPIDPDLLVVGMKYKNLYRSTDAGLTWVIVGAAASNPSRSSLTELKLLASDSVSDPDTYYCLQNKHAVLESPDRGLTWNVMPEQPFSIKALDIALVGDGSGDIFLGSYGGGIYEIGSYLKLADTYTSTTSTHLRSLDLGIDISFETGIMERNFQFKLKCQTFQGWAVWRAPAHQKDEMVLVGLYDRVNPESCIEGYCGNNNFEIIPQCYNSKRAACFNFDTPDTISFFDEEVFNGFSYFYAISSYDYGNTALASPTNSSQIAVYSRRWPTDTMSPYDGVGNRTMYRLNNEEAPTSGGEEIYVFPNPLRLDSGLPGQEGQTVTFTNLPPGSRVRVFTPAGDDVINLGSDNQHGGNIFWTTKNRNGDDVSPGVYLYKVEMLQQEDYWGRLVIIR